MINNNKDNKISYSKKVKRGQSKNAKQAKLTMEALILLILLIIGFIIILIVIFSIKWNPVIDKEVCHQSVIYRSSLKFGPVKPSEKIPLKCETELICFSLSGDDCREISGTKDNPIRKIKLNKDIVKAKDEIKNNIAESMKECHWMLGEGQLDFMPRGRTDRKYGLICTRFVFDDKAKEKIVNISMGEIYGTLEKKKLRDGRSYLEYIYPGWKNSENAILLYQISQTNPEVLKKNPSLKNINYKNFGINLQQERGYAIIAIMAPKGDWKSWVAGIGTAVAIPVGVGLLATGIGAPAGVILIGSATTIGATSFFAGSYVLAYTYPDQYNYYPPAIYSFNQEELEAQELYSFEIAP